MFLLLTVWREEGAKSHTVLKKKEEKTEDRPPGWVGNVCVYMFVWTTLSQLKSWPTVEAGEHSEES